MKNKKFYEYYMGFQDLYEGLVTVEFEVPNEEGYEGIDIYTVLYNIQENKIQNILLNIATNEEDTTEDYTNDFTVLINKITEHEQISEAIQEYKEGLTEIEKWNMSETNSVELKKTDAGIEVKLTDGTSLTLSPSIKFQGHYQFPTIPDGHYDFRTAKNCPWDERIVLIEYKYLEQGNEYLTDEAYFKKEHFLDLKEVLPNEYKIYKLRSMFA